MSKIRFKLKPITHDDLYDCVEQWEEDNGIRKGQWMVDWMRRLKEKETNQLSFEFGEQNENNK